MRIHGSEGAMMSDSKMQSSRRGSALLIVLGMFAFMLVSAVAFSVYMRASRAPSSYLLRNTSVRQVVKAAVARAIDEVDTAIGNDPFPDLGFNHDYGSNGQTQGDRYKNDNWHGRVFTPSNEISMASTVSTLTLEGLGYLPPCLVNEARYWSRHTRTAKWHAFNYGLGRYAFSVVNVSDFFDLNVFINSAGGERHHYLNRSSSPHGRISPTYLFRGGNESAMNTGGGAAAAFLAAISEGSGIGNEPDITQVPFVSLMDFNLSLFSNPLGGIASPFKNLIRDNNGSTFLSGIEDVARRTVYMAGGWNGGSNLTWNAYQASRRVNLKYPESQPFAGRNWVLDGSANLDKSISDVRTPFWLTIEPYIYPLTCALMCDYLDCDSVPVSLCIPSAEATPMLCGVTLNPDCVKYKVFYEKGEPGPADETTGKQTRIDTCRIEINIDDLETELTTVYPFASGSQGQTASYTVESFARVFFVEDSTLSDDNLNDDGLRNNFFNLGDNFTWPSGNDANASYMQVKLANGSVKPSDYLQSGQGEALEQAAVKGNLGGSASLSRNAKVAEITVEIDPDTGTEKVKEARDPGEIDFYNRDLSARVDFKAAFENQNPVATKYRPCVAVWARIVDANGKTVDMAPAILAYDNLNGFSGNKDIEEVKACAGSTMAAPALRFFAKQEADASAGVEPNSQYFKDQHDQEKKAQWKQTAYAVNDPRYNWAPEHWYAQSSGDPKNFWFTNVRAFRNGNDWCDPDIFMSVSDQGYLQSMYEFMMLPQIGSMITKEGMDCGVLDVDTAAEYNGKVRTSAADVAYKGLMWRTYRSEAFRKDPGEGGDTWRSNLGYLERIPFDDADNGLRVNPYTDITNVMFGAFANMPLDWAAAGTNWNNNGMADKDYMKPESGDFKGNNDYIFEWSYKYQDVYAMASFWMGLFRRTANADERNKLYGPDGWKDVFDDPDIVYWRTGDVYEDKLPNADRVEQILMDEMTSVDRKFLYGYLRGCFANTAQLFLVFVRAETTAGGAVGAGARAVALVWRDPAPPRDNAGNFVKATGGSENPQYGKDNAQQYLRPFVNNGPEESWRFRRRDYPPHRTRILFYHQFD